jgi:hypothetical protein
MGVLPPLPDPPIYRAFTIYPSTPSPSTAPETKPSWTTPLVKESNFPQSSLIAELSSLQDKDKASIADKIARLSTEQSGAVYNVLVDLVGEGDSAASTVDGEGKRLEWSVCEAARVRDEKRKGRTRCVRVFFVRAPLQVEEKEKEKEKSKMESEVSTRGGGKGKEIEKKGSRSRSRGKEKEKEKAIEDSPKERRKSTKERDRRESKGKGKEIERVEEKRSRRKSSKSRHRKEALEDDSDDCACDSDSTISIRSRNLRRSKHRTLSQRFKPKHSEVNPMAYGRAEQPRWEKPTITPPQYPVRGYQPAQPNEYHIRAAYEAGQRDANAVRMRNAALERGSLPQGPSHVISFERLRPGFEEWSEESYSQGYVSHSKDLYTSVPMLTGLQGPRTREICERTPTPCHPISTSCESKSHSSFIYRYPIWPGCIHG